jgi:hypothetical protein
MSTKRFYLTETRKRSLLKLAFQEIEGNYLKTVKKREQWENLLDVSRTLKEARETGKEKELFIGIFVR